MAYYPHPFSREESAAWIERNLRRYDVDGFGLLAIIEKGTGTFLGNCGPVVQHVEGVDEIELGWLVRRDRWREDIATEAALGCRDHYGEVLRIRRFISLVRPENRASRRVAEKIGMSIDREIAWGGEAWPHLVYATGEIKANARARGRRRSP